jgi:hypothetical protein
VRGKLKAVGRSPAAFLRMKDPSEITDEYRFYILRNRLAVDLILRAFEVFRSEGVEPILIKGWAAARNYPDFEPRFSGDIDLAVSANDYEKAVGLINSPDSTIRGIDLHRELHHLDTVDWSRLVSNSELVPLDQNMVRILCAEDHLRVLCVHWLTNGGEDKGRLWDIVYAVRYRPANFNWSKCLDVVGEHRRRWIITTIGIASKYLGLELDGLPFADEAKEIPPWLTNCLEKEWNKRLEIRPLHTQLRNPRSLLRQITKRIPPNPIMATINCDGDFKNRTRIGYQIRDLVQRFMPGARRVSSVLVKRAK